MADTIKFPTNYMPTEMAVFIVKHRLSYYEGVATSDEARSRLSNADFQRALRWLFEHYDFELED